MSRHFEEENPLVQVRLEKLQKLRSMGLDPFAVERYPITHPLEAIHEQFETLEGQTVCVAGRIFSIRQMGRATFAHLMDTTGKL